MNRSNTIRNFNEKHFLTFLEDYIDKEDESENSLLSNKDNRLLSGSEVSSSSDEYTPIQNFYIPRKRVMPIDIDTYRIIYSFLHKKLPANLCHIITDYVSRYIVV